MWKVHYLETVEAWLDKLNDRQYKSVAKELKLLELCGNELKMPHSRALGSGLFELRERSFGYRLYYIFDKERVIVLLHTGDKSSQEKDIKKAKQLQKVHQSRGKL